MSYWTLNKIERQYIEEHQRKSCNTCEFNCSCRCYGPVDTYGMSIIDTELLFPYGCEYWGISLDHFSELLDNQRKELSGGYYKPDPGA